MSSYLLCIALSFTNQLKVFLSSAQRMQSDAALICAARGTFYISANSPKHSPSLYVRRCISEPSSTNLEQLKLPFSTMNISLPSSPCFMTISPSDNTLFLSAVIIMSLSSLSTVLNIKEFLSRSKSSLCCASLFLSASNVGLLMPIVASAETDYRYFFWFC